MAYEQKESYGALFRETEKKNEKGPDYKGNIMLGGVVYELAGWKKEGTKGVFLSLKGQEPRQQDKPRAAAKPVSKFDDSDPIPF
jgi:hypothetical protein